ncbi:hypothetical protein DY052_07690 [Apilactobacillus timberlakei]|uniref:hypothetical protein n=1 Tax=Apilactobacillus timberlakei TaxID=2008380 RepID=UPI001128B7CB|nr:hypothetical protein [Apilactobacillus timberlakei]TPR13736.1 hypothetical protein DY052_07690 [Apilactobacillus timberlakei]
MSEIENKKTIDDAKQAMKENMDKGDNMFHQIDTEEIQKDNEQALAEIGQQIENYPKPSEVDQNSVKEYMANLYMTLKAIYSVTKNMNRALSQINANDRDLLNDKREKDFMNDNSNNSNLDPITRITTLESKVTHLDSFFNNASPQALAKLIEQLESYKNDDDMKMLAGMNAIFGERSPKEVKELIDKIGNGNDSLRVVKKDNNNHKPKDNNNDDKQDKNNHDEKSNNDNVNDRAAVLGADEYNPENDNNDSNGDQRVQGKSENKQGNEDDNEELNGRTKQIDDDYDEDDLPF